MLLLTGSFKRLGKDLAVICMGFKRFRMMLLLFAWVFKWYRLNPIQINTIPYKLLFSDQDIMYL